MAKNLYVGVGGKARKRKAAYIGISGKARKIKKIYVGVGGKARLVYQSYIPVTGISLTGKSGSPRDDWGNCYITASFIPSNATNKNVTWRVEDVTYPPNGGTCLGRPKLVSSTDSTCIVGATSTQETCAKITATSADGATASIYARMSGGGYGWSEWTFFT